MADERTPNVTDQRYYHVAMLVPRTQSFGLVALRRLLGAAFDSSKGRLEAQNSEDTSCRLETLCIHAGAAFAGSEEAKRAMAIRKKDMCAYDSFIAEIVLPEPLRWDGGAAKSLLMLGTSYAGLTRHVSGVLAKKTRLLDHALFGLPNLDGIVDLCRRPTRGVETRLTLTGIGTLRPGGKFVSGLRLSGKNVLAGGLLEEVEKWMQGAESEATEKRPASSKKSFLIKQNLRLRSEHAEGRSMVASRTPLQIIQQCSANSRPLRMSSSEMGRSRSNRFLREFA